MPLPPCCVSAVGLGEGDDQVEVWDEDADMVTVNTPEMVVTVGEGAASDDIPVEVEVEVADDL